MDKKLITFLAILCFCAAFLGHCDDSDDVSVESDLLGLLIISGGGDLSGAPGCSSGQARVRYKNSNSSSEVYRLYENSSCSTTTDSFSAAVSMGSTGSNNCISSGAFFVGAAANTGSAVTCSASNFTFNAGSSYTVEHTATPNFTQSLQ